MIITNEAELRAVGSCQEASANEIASLIAQLENELRLSAENGRLGIGLAAPQIGIAKRIAIVRLDNYKIDLINCVIERGYDKRRVKGEGCLSFPDRFEDTERWNEVHILGHKPEIYRFICTGLLAVAVQHEINHYDSILLPDVALKKNKKK